MPAASPMVAATPKPTVLKPGITRANIGGAFAKVYEYSGDDMGVLYLNPNSLDTFIKETETLGQWGFTREPRYSVCSRTSWSKDRNFNGSSSSGETACAGFFHTEGRHVMGYVLGFDIVADPELPLDEFRVRSARVSFVEAPKNSVAFPVEWIELSTQGFFRKTAIYTREATDRAVVLYRDEKVKEQYFEA